MIAFTSRDKDTDLVDQSSGIAPQLLNYEVPNIELMDLAGNQMSIDNLKGQVLLVNNWATWCPPCRAEMPVLENYYQSHKREGFMLIGINSGDKKYQVENFVLEYKLSFPIWLDPYGSAVRAFQNNALPSSYVIDRSGFVRMIWIGSVNIDALETYVTPLLNE
jgi:thiol-disulfide isomerase/thioredoxin